MTSDKSAIVLDNGSGMIKAGLAGDDLPSCVFPSVVGLPPDHQNGASDELDFCVGDDKAKVRRHPIKHGMVTDWDDMLSIWQHIHYKELKVDPEEHKVLWTEAPHNPKSNRNKMVEVRECYFHYNS